MRNALKRTVAAASVALVLGLTMSTVAFGDDADPDAQLQELAVELKKLDVADEDHVATQEIGKAEALRDKARTLVGDKKAEEQLRWTLEELEATVALVDAKISRHAAEKALAAARKAVDDKQQQIETMTAEADQLEKKQSELEKKLGGGK